MAEDSRDEEGSWVLRMLAAMMNGETLEAASAATRFGVERPAARRRLESLVRCVPGVSVVRDGRKKVYSFDRATLLAAEELQKERIDLITALAVSLTAGFSKIFANSSYQANLLQLRDRFVSMLPKSRRHRFASLSRKFFVLGGREEELADKGVVLDEVIEAILCETRLRLTYRKFEGTLKEETIEPYSLAIYDSHLYVLGPDIARRQSGLRAYRFSRIEAVEELAETFSYPTMGEYDPESAFRDSFGIWLGEPEPCRLRVRLSADWATFAGHHRWHSSQDNCVNEDGTVDVSFRARPCPEFEQWVLRFGEHAEVLEPEWLREKIGERLRKAAVAYG